MKLLTTQQAAEIAGCTDSTLRYAIKRGDLRAEKYGKTWLIERSELDHWIHSGKHKPGMEPRK